MEAVDAERPSGGPFDVVGHTRYHRRPQVTSRYGYTSRRLAEPSWLQ
ncbi:hypothetical protein WBK31_04960 [Nonomuraea sp. N2-4H]